MRDGSSGTRRGGFTNLFVVVEDEGLSEPDDFEEAPLVSTATSLERWRAVLFALGVSKASALERISTQNIPILTRCLREGECTIVLIVLCFGQTV